MPIFKPAGHIGGETYNLALTQCVINRPGDVIRVPVKPQFPKQRMLRNAIAGSLKTSAHLVGAVINLVDRTVDVLRGVFNSVAEHIEFGFPPTTLPKHSGTQPLRVECPYMER